MIWHTLYLSLATSGDANPTRRCLAHDEQRLDLAVRSADGAVATVTRRDHREKQHGRDGAARRHRHEDDARQPPYEPKGAPCDAKRSPVRTCGRVKRAARCVRAAELSG